LIGNLDKLIREKLIYCFFLHKNLLKRNDIKKFYNFDKIKIYGPNDLSKEFLNEYKVILSRRRGAGYWIWRIKIIEKELKNLDYDDILLFIDVGCSFKKKYLNIFLDLIQQLKSSDKSIIGFKLGYPEKKHTKVELFEYFNVSESSWIRNSKQLQGGILFMKKTEKLNEYVNLYIRAIKKEPELITDFLWKKQDKIFKEHRHDQSLHSVICKITNISLDMPDFTNSRKTPIMATRLGDRRMHEIMEEYFE
jgi:hypothetical protein